MAPGKRKCKFDCFCKSFLCSQYSCALASGRIYRLNNKRIIQPCPVCQCFFSGHITMCCGRSKVVLSKESAELVFIAKYLHRLIRVTRQTKLFCHVGCRGGRRVRCVCQNTVHLFLPGHIQNSFLICGADKIKLICSILTRIIRQKIAQYRFTAQPFCCFDRDNLLCRTTQKKKFFRHDFCFPFRHFPLVHSSLSAHGFL